MTRDQLLNAFLASETRPIFLWVPCPLTTWYRWNWEQNESLIIHQEIVSDVLKHLDIRNSIWPEGVHLRVLRELAEVLIKTLSIIYQQSWLSGEVPVD